MNLLKRTYGGAIILLVIFAITYFGHLSLSIGFTIFSLIAIREITEAFANIDIKLPKTLLYICDLAIMGAAYWQDKDAFILAIIFSVIALLVYMIFKENISFYTISIGIFILMYIPTLMGTIIRIRDINYIWPLYITAWGSDTFAYLVGSTIGRSKIKSIAHISPKKTIEGCIGGIIGALVLNLIYHKYNLVGINTSYVIIFSVFGAILSQIGDLVASFIKRKTGIKDFGNIIPGHGGILDRFDSMIFIAPILYLFSIM